MHPVLALLMTAALLLGWLSWLSFVPDELFGLPNSSTVTET